MNINSGAPRPRRFQLGLLFIGALASTIAVTVQGPVASARPGATPSPAATPPHHTPPPADHAKWDDRTWREQQALLSDSPEELGFEGEPGMPMDEFGNPADPMSHRGNPANGEYGTSREHCVGDGVSGERFYVYYGYPSSLTNDLFSDTRTFIRTKLGYANSYLYSSDVTYGQDIRWHCNSLGNIVVTGLPVANTDGSPATEISIDEIEAALRGIGHNVCRMGCSPHEPNSFLVMMDRTTNLPYCGLGWPGGSAPNNKDPYDRRGGVVADVRCWSGGTILHEVMHTQGSVLFNSPNSDGGHHCRGDHDVMCTAYGDGFEPCPNGATNLVDCGRNAVGGDTDGQPLQPPGQRQKEDYWDPSGGQFFLSTHWNTADSRWFTRPVLK